MFLTDKINDKGVYGVRICKNGEWKEVVVDDYIPCSKEGKPVFSSAHGNELWVILLEKAWAKLHGSYYRIEAGFAENVMHDLTGAPTEVIDSQREDLWPILLKADQKGWIMAASAGTTMSQQDSLNKDLGLVGGHSYGLIGVVEVIDRFGDPVQLVKLRNPWGEGEWTGAWSDQSDEWTPETKKIAGFSNNDKDGIFFMTIDDMRKYFTRIQICRIKDGNKYASFKARHKHGAFSLIRFNVVAPGGHSYL